jgi:hypothetical protein
MALLLSLRRIAYSTGTDKVVLGTRSTCNAYLAGDHDQKLTALKLLSVLSKHPSELFDFALQGSPWKSEENDTGSESRLSETNLRLSAAAGMATAGEIVRQ